MKDNKLILTRQGINVDEWRKRTNQPPLNPPKEEIVSCAYFPKHDPAILQAYIEKHKLSF